MNPTQDKTPIHLLLPMSGQGKRFQKAGYSLPKPLITVGGKPMIERLLAVFPDKWPTTAIIADNHLDTELPANLKRVRPGIDIISIKQHDRGPGFAILSMIDKLDENAPVLVSYCDYGMSWDSNRFEEFLETTNCDVCLISYRGFHAHYLSPVPYAYSRMDGELVKEVKEKGWFGEDREAEYASTGGYYFRSIGLLKKALAEQYDRGLILNGESYISLSIQALLIANPFSHVRIFEIPYFYQWGTPEDLETFEYWHNCLSAYSNYQGLYQNSYQVSQIMIPMCGLGSRFNSITTIPKPFIPIDGRAMFTEAIASLPRGDVKIIALEQHKELIESNISIQTQVKFLKSTPNGQALTVASGLEFIDEETDLIISACDHGIVLDPNVWQEFKNTNRADAAIFTITGFPAGKRNPNNYSWVDIDPTSTSKFFDVKRVSVKSPISEFPAKDNILVGTFWFRNKRILQTALDQLISREIKVNGEIYLDSVFNEMISIGLNVKVIPLLGFINWGDPDSLAESLYWQEIYFGRSYNTRPRLPGVK